MFLNDIKILYFIYVTFYLFCYRYLFYLLSYHSSIVTF